MLIFLKGPAADSEQMDCANVLGVSSAGSMDAVDT